MNATAASLATLKSVTVLIGHRGAPGYRPEHTRSSYEMAISQGVGAVEPDVVVSRDGVLVIRHENELSTTTDVATRPAFANRRTTRRVDGADVEGWFAEDFTWEELSTLRCRERIPQLRPENTRFDDTEPMLRLADLLELLAARPEPVVPVIEIKHAQYFLGLGFDLALLLDAELRAVGWAPRPLIIESFELGVLRRLRAAGCSADLIFLIDAEGHPADDPARDYGSFLTDAGVADLATQVAGMSLAKLLILDPDASPWPAAASDIVSRAHAAGLSVFTWTARPENAFLLPRHRVGTDPAARGDWRAEWAALRAAGVDGVFADHPDLASTIFTS